MLWHKTAIINISIRQYPDTKITSFQIHKNYKFSSTQIRGSFHHQNSQHTHHQIHTLSDPDTSARIINDVDFCRFHQRIRYNQLIIFCRARWRWRRYRWIDGGNSTRRISWNYRRIGRWIESRWWARRWTPCWASVRCSRCGWGLSWWHTVSNQRRKWRRYRRRSRSWGRSWRGCQGWSWRGRRRRGRDGRRNGRRFSRRYICRCRGYTVTANTISIIHCRWTSTRIVTAVRIEIVDSTI